MIGTDWQPGITVRHCILSQGLALGLEEARDAPRAPLLKDPDTCLRLSSLHPTPWHVFQMCQPPHTLKKQKLTNVDDDMEEGGLLHPWWEC